MTHTKQHAAVQEVVVTVDTDEEDIPLDEIAKKKEWEDNLRNDKTGWWLFAVGCCLLSALLPCKEKYRNTHNRGAAFASRVVLAIAAIAMIIAIAVLVPRAVDSVKPKFGLGRGYDFINNKAPGIARECVHVGAGGHIHVCRYPNNMGGTTTARTGPDYNTPAGPHSKDVYGSSNLTEQEWESIKNGNYDLLRQCFRLWGLHEAI